MRQSSNQSQTTRMAPGLLLLIGLLLTGILIFPDYGVSWDEAAMRRIGLKNLEVATTGNELGREFSDLDHGAAFELPLVLIERFAGARDPHEVTRIRHLTSFIYYAIGIGCGYLLALRLFKKQWLALLTMVMLVLQPRIFAHAFFNTKDVPFMIAMLIALYAIHAAFERGKGHHYILAGIACGFATGIRTMGALLIVLTITLILVDLIRAAKPSLRRKAAWRSLLFGLSATGALYMAWPALWHHPLDVLIYSIGNLSRYTAWTGQVLFNGEIIPGAALPWYYIPEWFCISTPLVWLALGAAGIIIGFRRIVKTPVAVLETARGRLLTLCAACFALPVMAVILLQSVLYDDWRHLYFIYPPFVLMATFGAEKICSRWKARIAVQAGCAVQAAAATAFMISAHPFQQVYFNPLMSHKPEHLRSHFDYEYWGTSYKQALEYVLANDTRDPIPVVDNLSPIVDNWAALPEESRGRIRWTTDRVQGAYLITNFRGERGDQPYPKVWGIKVGGSTVVQVYRIDTALAPM